MMEDSQVLDAESKAAPLQAPEAIHETSVSVAPQNETPNKNIYGGPSPVVGEKDHANEISTNINRSDYSFKSPVDNSKEPTVTTVSTTKGNVTDKTEWQAHYGMEDTYKAKANEDYSWNKIAQERAQYTYEQEATQVLSDYAKSMMEIKEAGAQAMDQYFSAAYSANQTADKMGWSGGQVTSNDAKTAFLRASTAAGMYDKFELQKYGVESQLTVARLYAEANMEALALDMYQDAIDLAVREAELVGYYIAPEASEIMKQQQVANDILNDKNSTAQERQRANQVIGAGNAYFDKLGFERDEFGHYKGIKTLSHLEFLETKRANQRQEALQNDANKIAKDAVAAQREGIAAQKQIANAQLALARDQLEAEKNLQRDIQKQNNLLNKIANTKITTVPTTVTTSTGTAVGKAVSTVLAGNKDYKALTNGTYSVDGKLYSIYQKGNNYYYDSGNGKATKIDSSFNDTIKNAQANKGYYTVGKTKDGTVYSSILG